MFLIHKTEGGSETVYEFRPDRVDYNRAVVAEKMYSKICGERRTWEQFVADAMNGSIAARRVALWLCITNTHPLTRFEDTPSPRPGDMQLERSREEFRQIRVALADADVIESEKQIQLAAIDKEILVARVGSDEPDQEPDPEVQEPGKDPKPADEVSTT